MLTILHTGDFHLGKIFYEYSLIEDQAFMLTSLKAELEKCRYDALVISGDIYDRAVPPSEAVQLFSDFLNEIHALCPERPVGIISGNHDSAARLGFGAELLRNENIHICTEEANCTQPVILKNASGKAEAALYLLPFLRAGSLTSEDGTVLRSQQDLAKEAVRRIKAAHEELQKSDEAYKNLAPLLACHVFTTGVRDAGTERVFAGTAELIDSSIFDFFAYTAAGHIHKMQKIGERLYYSGSPLAYSFDEAGKEKCFLKVEFDGEHTAAQSGQPALDARGALTVTALPVKSLRRVVKISGSFEELCRSGEYAQYANDYVECTYTDPVIAENAVVRLREKFPFLLSVKQQAFDAAQNERSANAEKKKRLLENESGLPLKEILYAFLADTGLISEDKDADWQSAVDLFIKIDGEAKCDETA